MRLLIIIIIALSAFSVFANDVDNMCLLPADDESRWDNCQEPEDWAAGWYVHQMGCDWTRNNRFYLWDTLRMHGCADNPTAYAPATPNVNRLTNGGSGEATTTTGYAVYHKSEVVVSEDRGEESTELHSSFTRMVSQEFERVSVTVDADLEEPKKVLGGHDDIEETTDADGNKVLSICRRRVILIHNGKIVAEQSVSC